MRQTYWNLPCERGVKCSEGCQKLKMEATKSDFDVLPFLWKRKRNNESDNLKTRNNYSLHVQVVALWKKMNQNQRWLSIHLLYKQFFNRTTVYKDIFRTFIWHGQKYATYATARHTHFCQRVKCCAWVIEIFCDIRSGGLSISRGFRPTFGFIADR